MKKKQKQFTDREQTLIEVAVAASMQYAIDGYNEALKKHGEDNGITKLYLRNRDELIELSKKVIKSEKLTRIYYEQENENQ